MVTLDEQRALQLENAKADEQFWSSLHDMHAGNVEGHKALAATVERAVADGQAGMADNAEKRDTAKERRERLERGEDVPGGIGKPFTREDAERILREAGVDLQHVSDIGELSNLMGFDALCDELNPVRNGAMARAEKAVIRALLRKFKQ